MQHNMKHTNGVMGVLLLWEYRWKRNKNRARLSNNRILAAIHNESHADTGELSKWRIIRISHYGFNGLSEKSFRKWRWHWKPTVWIAVVMPMLVGWLWWTGSAIECAPYGICCVQQSHRRWMADLTIIENILWRWSRWLCNVQTNGSYQQEKTNIESGSFDGCYAMTESSTQS